MVNTSPPAGTQPPTPSGGGTEVATPVPSPAPDYSPDYLPEYTPAPEDPRMPTSQPPHLLRPRGPLRDAPPPEASQPLPRSVALRNSAQLLFLIVLFVVLIIVAWEWETGGWRL